MKTIIIDKESEVISGYTLIEFNNIVIFLRKISNDIYFVLLPPGKILIEFDNNTDLLIGESINNLSYLIDQIFSPFNPNYTDPVLIAYHWDWGHSDINDTIRKLKKINNELITSKQNFLFSYYGSLLSDLYTEKSELFSNTDLLGKLIIKLIDITNVNNIKGNFDEIIFYYKQNLEIIKIFLHDENGNISSQKITKYLGNRCKIQDVENFINKIGELEELYRKLI